MCEVALLAESAVLVGLIVPAAFGLVLVVDLVLVLGDVLLHAHVVVHVHHLGIRISHVHGTHLLVLLHLLVEVIILVHIHVHIHAHVRLGRSHIIHLLGVHKYRVF